MLADFLDKSNYIKRMQMKNLLDDDSKLWKVAL